LRDVICLHIFPGIVGAVSAADLLAASLTGKLVSIGRGGGKNLRRSKTPWFLAVTALAILVLVAIDVQHRLGMSAEVLQPANSLIATVLPMVTRRN
jgi:hypothetical protein